MNAHNFKNRTGEVHNGWAILEYVETTKKNRPKFKCQCVCGFIGIREVRQIVNNVSKSCGCLNAKNHVTHGLSKTPTYKIWKGMKDRCSNQNSEKFKYYGGRGISVCERWMISFDNFLLDMGERPAPELSIDRINNGGNYEPSNCRWATKSQQASNRRKPLPPAPTKKSN